MKLQGCSCTWHRFGPEPEQLRCIDVDALCPIHSREAWQDIEEGKGEAWEQLLDAADMLHDRQREEGIS